MLNGLLRLHIAKPRDGTFYKGSSERPAQRLIEHNNGESQYTKSKIPWVLVYIEELSSKTEMLIRERKLKRGNKEYFERLIQSPKNIVQLIIENQR